MEGIFGLPWRTISEVFIYMRDHIHSNFNSRLTDLDRWAPCYGDFADAIYSVTGRDMNCVGFIDGKVFRTCKPIRFESVMYTGHKKCHGIKAQSVVYPNGIIGHFKGPWVASRNDARMLRESHLLDAWRAVNHGFHNIPQHGAPVYSLYGDPAYPLSRYIQRPYLGHPTRAQQAFNADMSSARVSVEWGFGWVVSQFPYVDCRHNVKVWENNPQKHIDNSVLLANLLTILNGNEFNTRFNCWQTLSIEDYFN